MLNLVNPSSQELLDSYQEEEISRALKTVPSDYIVTLLQQEWEPEELLKQYEYGLLSEDEEVELILYLIEEGVLG